MVLLAGMWHKIFEDPWLIIGFIGQFFFMMRFVVQWLRSEKEKKSVVPVAFWFFSLGGGVILLAYAIIRKDPVFILGQGLGLLIYLRNLWLIYGKAARQSAKAGDSQLRQLTAELVDMLQAGNENLPQPINEKTMEIKKILQG